MELTNTEKVAVINARIKNIRYVKYNGEIDLLIENAKAEPLAATVSTIQADIANCNSQITKLEAELAKYPVESAGE
jgi:ABC-type phosphate transport system auxiliary subunit